MLSDSCLYAFAWWAKLNFYKSNHSLLPFWSQLKHAFGRECARYWSKRFNFPCRKWGQCPAALSAAIKKAFAGIQFSLPVKTSFNPPTMPRYFVRRSRILIPRLIGDFLCQIGYSFGQVIPVHDLQRWCINPQNAKPLKSHWLIVYVWALRG